MGKFFDEHKKEFIVALSGAILLGSGISLGLGFSQLQAPHPEFKAAGFSSSDPGQPATQSASQPISGPININTASAVELEALPRIGPALAQRIVDYRKDNGPFKTTADIEDVSGIGPSIYAQIKDLITVK
ncbi:MAG: ComEA family DNA-binding protein [Patescibacteria group bacterium]